jgi:hypothetical protein
VRVSIRNCARAVTHSLLRAAATVPSEADRLVDNVDCSVACPGLVQSRAGIRTGRVLRSIRSPRLQTAFVLLARAVEQRRTGGHDRPDVDALQLRLLRVTRSRSQVKFTIRFVSARSVAATCIFLPANADSTARF